MGVFDNKTAIVLGGTSGIGLATAEMLRDRGAQVIAGSRRKCTLDGIETVQIDVQDRDGLQALFEKHQGFDYLVNAATGGKRAIGIDITSCGFGNRSVPPIVIVAVPPICNPRTVTLRTSGAACVGNAAIATSIIAAAIRPKQY